ncbi:uncharacterized protein LOC128278319 [Anopheles cruzii]|uniref:uncharacterized protein LOC128278319 n=1 Tax=Anopheles cruzii TaxID=68878 RepID=UPI0022EC772B|nr:uncharacterized protein LOC128278319 [Anopheles cruzii]
MSGGGGTKDSFDEQLVDESSQYMLDDLQLAAELGKTLLERNKELEATLKYHQSVIEDQVQEIEYLTKQNGALREVNDSRMKIYEQLEVSIQDLERDKYKLALEYQAEKKHVKQLCCNIESLETKVEELTRTLEEVRRQAQAERRSKTERSATLSPDANAPVQWDVELNAKRSGSVASRNSDTEQTANVAGHRMPTVEPSGPYLPSADSAVSGPGSGIDEGAEVRADRGHIELDELQRGSDEVDDEVIRMIQALERTQKSFMLEQSKVVELEEQLAAIAQENQALQKKLMQVHPTEEMISVHHELSVLDEVMQGQMCTRCLRGFEDRPDGDSIITGTEDDDRSLIDLIEISDVPRMYRSSINIQLAPTKPDSLDLSGGASAAANPYRELVEKYEALLEVHRQPAPAVRKTATGSGNNTPVDSCQPQELPNGGGGGASRGSFADPPRYLIEINPPLMGDSAYHSRRRPSDEQRPPTAAAVTGAAVATVPAKGAPQSEYSETETASSGYSDEVSNKATQTDESPRNFLCTIADGKDWRFSIYEDQSAIDSRFRFSPAHRELFREIFSVLKRAAENRDEGDQLPLLDDTKPPAPSVPVPVPPMVGLTASRVPPVTPANEEPPSEFGDGDDTASFITTTSSAVSEQSFAMSECITKSERRKMARQQHQSSATLTTGAAGQADGDGASAVGQQAGTPGILPLPLEYLSVAVGVSKRRSRRRRSHRTPPGADASGQQVAAPPAASIAPQTTPRSHGRKNRYRPWNPDKDGGGPPISVGVGVPASGRRTTTKWDGSTMTIYNRCLKSPSLSPSAAAAAAAVATSSTPATERSHKPQPAASSRAASYAGNRYAELAGGEDDGSEIVQFTPSTASQHLHNLQKLDLSYAEVLRRADTCHPYNVSRRRHQQQQQQQPQQPQ